MSDAEFLKGLSVLHGGAFVAEVAGQLDAARHEGGLEGGNPGRVEEIKEFVNEAFAGARERFSERRKDGARRMRGSGAAAKGVLWSARDLRVGI